MNYLYDIQENYKPCRDCLYIPWFTGNCSTFQSALEFPTLASLKWFFVFRVCQLPFVCSRDEQRFTSQRGVVFCLLRSAADRDPSLLLLTVNISHVVMNVLRQESRSRLSALTSRVFSLSVSRLLFLTTIYSHLCLRQSRVLRCGHRSLSMGKYQPQQHPGTHFSNHVVMCLSIILHSGRLRLSL